MDTRFAHRQHILMHSWFILLAILALACSCNLPLLIGTPPPAAFTPPVYPTYTSYPTYTPIPVETLASSTRCQPTITAKMEVNVRKGPSKAYDIAGALTTGQSASVLGRSESQFEEWWYIQYSAAPGGGGWVWGEAVTAACIPSGLQVVAAPPTPKPQTTDTALPPPQGGGAWGVSTKADLAVTDLFSDNWPQGRIYVRITNNGPDSLVNFANNQLSCTNGINPYDGSPPHAEGASLPLTLTLIPGQTEAFDTGITVNGTLSWYSVTCSIEANFEDPNSSNNSYSETFPPPP